MKIVCLVSGGMDSATLLASESAIVGDEVYALACDYGQEHLKGLARGEVIADHFGCDFRVVGLDGYHSLIQQTRQTADPVMVPNRMMMMIATAVGYAIELRAEKVVYAVHAGDKNRPEYTASFGTQMMKAILECHPKPPRLGAPFLRQDKADLVNFGRQLKVPFESTWNCQHGRDLHCGVCPGCSERIAAFDTAGCPDETLYERRPAKPTGLREGKARDE